MGFRKGLEAQLKRAEHYHKKGQLRALDFHQDGNRYDLVLVTDRIVEVKYWTRSYASDPDNIRRLTGQLKRYKESHRRMTLELVMTKTDPIERSFLAKLEQELRANGLNVTIRIVP